MAKGDTTKDDDILEEAKEAFEDARDSEADNRVEALDDLKFARLGEQWTDTAIKLRGERRPRLTINKMPAFIRQVTNDARQNKPSIKVRPVDDDADIHTAEVMNGIIRNIETASNADVAYDTAADCAVTTGFGYFRVNVEYSHDDTFDQDIVIEPVPNQFSIYGDPNSTCADSSDWMSAFVTEWIPCKEFKRLYPDADKSNWEGGGEMDAVWRTEDQVLRAEWWKREEVARKILLISNPDGTTMVVGADVYEEQKDLFDVNGAKVDQEREVRSYKVTHRLLSGAEILEETDWPGRYIPIIPVYGEEVNLEGKRIFRSLIRDAKDPQRMFNYWKTTATELVALAPRAPWTGPEKAFRGEDSERWETANTENWDYLSYPDDTPHPPTRVPFAGIPAGALQEAMNSSDDMKAVIGLYDASLGAKSNETSGKAIIARERQGDVSTFHFIDNLSRGIKHGGRILIDLIPHVYSGERIVRILGPEGQVATAKLGQRPQQDASASPPAGIPQKPGQMQPAPGQPVPWPPKPPQAPDGTEGAFDLSVGKYDLVVDVGPSYTTRRAEAAEQMMQLIQSFPQAAPVIGDLVAKNLDWPGAQEIGDRLYELLPPQLRKGPDGQPLPNPAMIQMEMEQQQKLAEQVTKIIVEKLKAGGVVESARIKAGADLSMSMADTLAQLFTDAQQQGGETAGMPAPIQAPGLFPTQGPPPQGPPQGAPTGFPGPQ